MAVTVEVVQAALKGLVDPNTHPGPIGGILYCISKKGLKSDDTKIVKKANFAKNIGGYKGAEHNEVKNLEESIIKIIQNHLPPHTTKGELLNSLNKRKR